MFSLHYYTETFKTFRSIYRIFLIWNKIVSLLADRVTKGIWRKHFSFQLALECQWHNGLIFSHTNEDAIEIPNKVQFKKMISDTTASFWQQNLSLYSEWLPISSFLLREVNCQILAGKFDYVRRTKMSPFSVQFRKAPMYLALLVAEKTLNEDEWVLVVLFLGMSSLLWIRD